MRIRCFNRQQGYTFVELVIAMAIGSFVLVALTGGIIRLYQMYEAGIALRKTQESVRTISDDISSHIRDSKGYRVVQNNLNLVDGSLVQQDRVCVFSSVTAVDPSINGGAIARVQGDIYFTNQVSPSVFVLRRGSLNDTLVWPVTDADPSHIQSSCPTSGNGYSATNLETLSSNEVSVLNFSANRTGGFDSRMLRFGLAAADTSSLDSTYIDYSDPANLRCRGTFGSQFCSVTQVNTSATMREEN